MQKKAFYILLVSAMIFGSCHTQRRLSNSTTGIQATGGIQKVGHVVVIYMENHSFDNLYGEFDGADGLNGGKSSIIQVDTHGTVYPFLPALPHVYPTGTFPSNLPNQCFNIDQFIPSFMETPDVLHQFYEEQDQINHDSMNRYAFYNGYSAGMTMGYYHTKMLPLYAIA